MASRTTLDFVTPRFLATASSSTSAVSKILQVMVVISPKGNTRIA